MAEGGLVKYDLVVVGGGTYGLTIPKTYLEVNPSARVLLLDAGQSIGGTWSAERMYPCLRSNSIVGFLEFSDFPMDFDTFGVAPGSHVPGDVLHRYLNAYVDYFGFRNRIRLDATVVSAELTASDEWLVRYLWKKGIEDVRDMKLVAKKLVLAMGTTSAPNIPVFPGSNVFGGAIFHSVEAGSRAKDMKIAKNVVVLGGSKSAADAVYMNASEGRHVDWVIRASGNGPKWLSPVYLSPFKLCVEKLMTTRFVTFLSPTLDKDSYPTIRKFFHNSFLGQLLLRVFLAIIGQDMLAKGRYNDHPETRKLIPSENVYWFGTSIGTFNYPIDLFSLIQKGLVHIHIADVDSLSSNTVHLRSSSGALADLPADMLICATGYKHTLTVQILPPSISDQQLGLSSGTSTSSNNDALTRAADAEIARRFPGLARAQELISLAPSPSWSLYRGIVPPGFVKSRNLACVGMAVAAHVFLNSEISALWTTAFLDGALRDVPNESEAAWVALLQSRFWRARAPLGLGARGPAMAFEVLPYVDTMLRDLGLRTERKGGWWSELFESYSVADYKGFVQEWLEARKDFQQV